MAASYPPHLRASFLPSLPPECSGTLAWLRSSLADCALPPSPGRCSLALALRDRAARHSLAPASLSSFLGFSPWSPASRLRKAAKKPNAKYRPEPEAAGRARQCKGLPASTGSAPPLTPSTLPGACDGSGRRKRHDFWVHGRPGVAGLVARAPGAHGTLAVPIAASSPPLAHRDCSCRRLIAVTRCDPPAGLPPAGDPLPVSLTPLAS